jgi:serine/threonine protein kinase
MELTAQIITEVDWAFPERDIEVQDTVLGRGAFGEVKIAKWRNISVAAKRLHTLSGHGDSSSVRHSDEDVSAVTASLKTEMELLSKLRHPNLLLFLGICYDKDLKPTTILTELMPCNLYDVLEVHKIKLSLAEVLDISLDIATGLEYLHSHNPIVVHRDISSKNILLGGNKAKIADLGQAKVFGSSFLSRQTSMPGAMAYSAPEVLTGKYSAKIDVFSFGVLLVQMGCSEYPRIERREDQLKRAVGVHPVLNSLMTSCMKYLPDERPSVAVICRDLKAIKENDRYYPPARRLSPECDLGVLARRWMNGTIEDRCKDTVLALEQTSRRVGVEEERWRDEAARVDRAEKENHELKTQLACSGDSLGRAKADMAGMQARLEDTQRALEISRQATSSLAAERASAEEKLQQNMQQSQTLNSNMSSMKETIQQSDKQKVELSKQLEAASDRIQRLEAGERDLGMRLDMQLDHSREMEVRLEQALTRWKQEKGTSQKETDRCSRLRANCSSLVEKNQRLQLEMERQTEKLQLYDSLPMPEEIKARMSDLDSDLRNKTEEANDLMSAYEDLKKQHALYYEENERLCNILNEKDEELIALDTDRAHMQATIDHLHEKSADLNKHAALERSSSMTMLEGERKNISDLRQELEDVKESQRQDRVALAHAVKAKKKAQLQGGAGGVSGMNSQSMSRMGSIQSFDNGEGESGAFEEKNENGDSGGNSPSRRQHKGIGTPNINNQIPEGEEGYEMEDDGMFGPEGAAEGGEVYTRDPDVRAKAQINIAIEKQDMAGILHLIQINTKNENFSWRGARALREMFIHSEEKKAECISLKGDDILLASMDMFPHASMVQAQCLRAVGALAFGNDAVRRQAGTGGVFKKIVAAMDNHMGDESVLLHALTAVTNITHNSIDNRFRFLEAQGTEAVLAVMARYEPSAKLQRQACWALLTVAGSDEIARAVAEFPVGAAVVSAMVKHR